MTPRRVPAPRRAPGDAGADARARRAARVRGLYGMVDVRPGERERARVLGLALIEGGARVVQLRMKEGRGGELLAAAEDLRSVIGGRALLVVNDRLDVALLAGADGVHLGQDDLPLEDALEIAREARSARGFLIGVSTHNEVQALAAAASADYVALGPIYATASKRDPDPVVGLGRLAEIARSLAALHPRTPLVAIGGIDAQRAAEVARAGAHAAAVIGAVNTATDVIEAARRISAAFERS